MRRVPVVATTQRDKRTEDSAEPTHPPPPTLALWFAAIGWKSKAYVLPIDELFCCAGVNLCELDRILLSTSAIFVTRSLRIGRCVRKTLRRSDSAKIKERERRRETDRNPQQKLKIKNLYKKIQMPAVNSCMKNIIFGDLVCCLWGRTDDEYDAEYMCDFCPKS